MTGPVFLLSLYQIHKTSFLVPIGVTLDYNNKNYNRAYNYVLGMIQISLRCRCKYLTVARRKRVKFCTPTL